jgi:hypothetical protein
MERWKEREDKTGEEKSSRLTGVDICMVEKLREPQEAT